jgi:hypothetical protein
MANGPKASAKAVPPPSNPPPQPISPQSSTTQPAVNRKKAKRRQKAALKAAAADALDPISSNNLPLLEDNDDLDDSDEYDFDDDKPNGHPDSKKKSKKKKKNKAMVAVPEPAHHSNNNASNQQSIWNTSSQEEQNQIKDFWHGLTESERKSLVKIEKDAVLKTLKEQQKQSCSCTVCGRKRTAIEEELETLYDAYYNELETYDLHNPQITSHQLPYRSPTGSSLAQLPPMNRDYPEEVFDEDDEYDEESESYPYEDETDNFITSQLFDFGNSLTVKGSYNNQKSSGAQLTASQGGILTVADDLLKNDGKKFIEMMEKLAERRMKREQQALQPIHHSSHSPYNGHDSQQAPDDESFDEEEDEYEDEEDDYEDEEEVHSHDNLLPVTKLLPLGINRRPAT